ncbi:NAD(P)-dependent oxidoreductase [Bacteroidota bacterium]
MLIWKNTATLDGYDDGLDFTDSKKDADIALLGGKSIKLTEFPNVKGIFRAGIGRDNVPEKEAKKKDILVKYPSNETINIIFEETACFTCSLIFQMLYANVGTLDPWEKEPRLQLSEKTLLIIGNGRIGGRVAELMKHFMNVTKFDILQNETSELKQLMQESDCVSIHIPKSERNVSFINQEKLSWMRNDAILVNTARGAIVDENALYKELYSRRLKAAFDVYWQEPYEGILKNIHPDYFHMTPHVASTCIGFLKGCRKDLNKLIIELNKNEKY